MGLKRKVLLVLITCTSMFFQFGLTVILTRAIGGPADLLLAATSTVLCHAAGLWLFFGGRRPVEK